MRERRHSSPDGLELVGYEWAPEGQPKAILQIIHGMAEHGKRYASVGEHFAAQGWLVHAHDQRGHGQSVDTRRPLGHMADDDSFQRSVEDAHRINRSLREEHPGVPVVVMGHSMGSFHTQALLYTWPEDGDAFVLSGSNGKPPFLAMLGRGVARLERRRLGHNNASALLTKLSFGDFNKGFEGRTTHDWLSRDNAEVDAYIADPACGQDMTTQVWVDLLDGLFDIARPENIGRIPKDKPLYIFAGDADPVGDKGKGIHSLASAYRRAGLGNVDVKLYPSGRHEMLNETNRDEVIDDLLRWCTETTAS